MKRNAWLSGILFLVSAVCSAGYFQIPIEGTNQVASSKNDLPASLNEFYQQNGWRSGRIVGGQDADIRDYPWQVALMQGDTQFCGGSIIHNQWILTAAHCVQGSWNAEYIRAGVTNKTHDTGLDVNVEQIFVHPGFGNPVTFANDIALLRLEAPLDFNNPDVSIIDLVTQEDADSGLTNPGTQSFITGWGALAQGGASTNMLQVAMVNLVSNEDAMNQGGYPQGSITPDMLCAGDITNGGTDACQGDSGGPLAVIDNEGRYRLAGVTSWGNGCAQPGFPGVYSRVSYFEEWIKDIVPFADPAAPASPTAFQVNPLNDGSFQADITWINPSATFSNDSLTELSAIKILRNSVVIHTLENPTPGTQASFTDIAGPVHGFYTYSIYGINSEGDGPKRYATAYLGEDVPAAPQNVLLQAIGNGGLISWDAPAEGSNNGYLVPQNTTYTIIRMPDNITIAQGISETEYTDNTIQHEGTYYYIIRASNNVGEGQSALSNRVFLGNEDLFAVTIGDGNLRWFIPYNFWFHHSLSQTLYFPHEIGEQNGIISAIQYYNDFAGDYHQKHITIYMGETNKSNLTEGWIDPSGLHLVFEGLVDFPAGQNNIYIQLQTEYVYHGGNLVIYNNKEDYSYLSGQTFVTSLDLNSGRTRTTYRDSSPFDPDAPPVSSLMSSEFPNTTLVFSTNQLGSLEGQVSNGQNPVEGVKIKIADTYFTTHTNANGFFSFPLLPEGAYQAELSAFGYYPKEISFHITGDQTTLIDETLTSIPSFSVSGQISANDGLFPQGVSVSLAGYDNYHTLTDENGNFTIHDVFMGTYSVTVIADGYDTYTDHELPVEADLNLQIELTESIMPPIRLEVNIDDHPNGNALFSWNNPGLVKLFQHEGNLTPNAFFQNKNRVYGTVFNLENYPDAVISYIDFHHMQWGQPDNIYPYTIYVVNWQNFEVLETIGPLNTTIINGWEQMISLDSIDVAGLQQVAILINAQGNILNDAFPCITGDQTGPNGLSVVAPLSNLQNYTINGSNMGDFLINLWITTAEEGKELIQAPGLLAENTSSHLTRRGKDASLPENQLNQHFSDNNIINKNALGYNVFFDGIQIEENHPGTTYLFDNLAEGQYTAGVQSVFNTGLSEIKTIDFQMVYDVDGKLAITANSGIVPSGAEVLLRNSTHPGFAYTGFADNQAQIMLSGVRKGQYSLRITLDGFHLYEEENIIIDEENFLIEAELQEIITAPSHLLVTTRDQDQGSALFSWNNNFEPAFQDSFEDRTFNAWEEFIPGNGTGGEGGRAFWHIARPDGAQNGATAPHGSYVAKVQWGYNIDSWLISPAFTVESYTSVSFFWNSNYNWSVDPFPNAQLMLKVSEDGGQNWEELWNWQRIGPWESFVWYNSVVPLQQFEGQQIQIAFQLLADNNANTQLDNIIVGWADSEGDFRVSEKPLEHAFFARSNQSFLRGSSKEAPMFNVFLNDQQVAGPIQHEEFLFTHLEPGYHVAGVQSVFLSGTSEIVNQGFTIQPPVYPLTFTVIDNLKLFDQLWIKGEMTDPSWTETILQEGPSNIWKTTIGVSPGSYQWSLGGHSYSGDFDWQLPEGQYQQFTLNDDGSVSGQLSYLITGLSTDDPSYTQPLVFPNPASDYINITSRSTIKKIALTDIGGRLIYSESPAYRQVQIDATQLEAGIYILQVFTSQAVFTQKIKIIKHNH